MNRRDFLKLLALGIVVPAHFTEAMAQVRLVSVNHQSYGTDDHIKDYIYKMKNYDKPHDDDIRLSNETYNILKSTVMRLRSLEAFAGHGNFHIMSFDRGLQIANGYSKVGPFTSKELKFMEKLFYSEAGEYGFLDQKPLKNITDRVNRRSVMRLRESGNYIYKGRPVRMYKAIKKEIGEKVILTSGIRGVMKQFLLFLNKVYINEGNLSLASRSLAPPGYSYHSIGDFDIGQTGLGSDNFTARFAATEVYRKLSDLGYLKLRYPQDNVLGVRYEPWHIKT